METQQRRTPYRLDLEAPQALEAGGLEVVCLDFSPDGQTLLAAAADGRVSLWRREERASTAGLRTRCVTHHPGARYYYGMKKHTKSSITLPPAELKLVTTLQSKLPAKSKSKVEVVRRGLRLLQDLTDRESLREAYRRASQATRAALSHELAELDELASEGLDES
jgi:hypothetical protein